MKFSSLAKLDQRLVELEDDVIDFARVYGTLPERCANSAWYGFGKYEGKGFKKRITELVGWNRKRTLGDFSENVLRDSRAYVVVTDYLYDLLPDCAGCTCMEIEWHE